MQTATARVVWSFRASDPADSTGSTAEAHDHKGSLSLNLLGGLRDSPPTPDDMQSFDLAVSNVRQFCNHIHSVMPRIRHGVSGFSVL